MKRICINCGYIDVSKMEACPVCQKSDWEDYDIYQIKKISTDESFVGAMIKLKNDNPIEYQLKMKQFELQKEQEKQLQKIGEESNTPHCPHCKSTSIKPISSLNRGASIAMWGIFSKKINKSFECKNCGYTW